VANIDYPRLCGGTFFTLLLQARKQRTKPRQHIKGERDGLSDSEVLFGLIKVVDPDFDAITNTTEKTFKGNTSDFRSCKKSKGTYLPFNETTIFDNRMKNGYSAPLQKMCDFIKNFIDVGTSSEKDIRLVKALLELIDSDQSINDDQVFYIGETGTVVTKAELRNTTMVCLQSFLLGVWHFALIERKDNSIGKDTFDIWCPATGGGVREYTGNIGNGITRTINLKMATVADSLEIISDEPFAENAEQNNKYEPEPSTEQINMQTLHRPMVVNQSGTNNTNIAYVESLTISNGGG